MTYGRCSPVGAWASRRGGTATGCTFPTGRPERSWPSTSPDALSSPDGRLLRREPDGSVRQVADDIAFPNGMAVTADNATLIVADSYRHRLVAFDIGVDGGLSNRRVWADLGEGTPD